MPAPDDDSKRRGRDGRDGLDGKDGRDGRDADPAEVSAEVQRQLTALCERLPAYAFDADAFQAEVLHHVEHVQAQRTPAELQRAVTTAVRQALEQRAAEGAAGDGPAAKRGPRGPKGDTGEQGERGPMPRHEWNGTRLRFERPGGSWGDWVDLRGPQGPGGGGTVTVSGGGSGNGYFPQGW